jgi:hypothetical protein
MAMRGGTDGMSRPPVEAYPLYWPEGWKRATFRRNAPEFREGIARNHRDLTRQIELMGGTDIIISSNLPVRNDGLPYADATAGRDPGVAVYFNYRKKPMCFACDQYVRVHQNLRAITLTIEALRGIERWGASDMMERAFKGFTALPEQSGQYWREVLEIPPDAKPTPEFIEKTFRMMAHVYHPDKGGTHEEWLRLVNARENALRDLGATR